MLRRIGRWAVPLFLIAGLLGVAIDHPNRASAEPPSYSQVRTDGQTIVWSMTHEGKSWVYSQPVGASQPSPTTELAQNGLHPDVSGDIAVWEQWDDGYQHSDIVGKNLKTGERFQISSSGGVNTYPAISGSWAVWIHADALTDPNSPAHQSLMARNLNGGQPEILARSNPGTVSIDRPAISGTNVVWADLQANNGWELWLAVIGGSLEPQVVSNSSLCTNGCKLTGYDVGGRRVVFGAGNTINEVDILSPGYPGGSGFSAPGTNPTTDGRYIFWQDTAPVPGHPYQRNIIGADFETTARISVANVDGMNITPFTRGGVVTWLAYPYQTSSAMPEVASIASILPTAPQPNPNKTDPNWTYYPQTQHYLSYGFRDFWQASGGLPVFGYPLTEEFAQRGVTTQYFERQRFEYHPDNPVPYKVELGLLGSEDAWAHRLMSTAPFTAAMTAADPGCLVFTPTKHQVCGAFLAYWQGHGLNLGDPGISFRESLALFGYPISEQYVDPATGLQTQYFERAVMEWHPNNPEPWKVELRLLGSQQLQSVGW